MTREAFEQLVAEEFPKAVPEKFRHLIRNVVFLVESEPSQQLRALEQLRPNETLLGHYRGVPTDSRGSSYGVGGALPDTITLFQLPLEEEAGLQGGDEEATRAVIRETIWHEVGHHFGLDEFEVRKREEKRQSKDNVVE